MPTINNIIVYLLLLTSYSSFSQKWEEPNPLCIYIDLNGKYVQNYSIAKNNDRASFSIYKNGYESGQKRKKSIANYNKKIASCDKKKIIREYIEYPSFSIGFISLEKPEKLEAINKIKYISAEEFSSAENVKITHPTFIIYQQKDGTYLRWKVFIGNIKE